MVLGSPLWELGLGWRTLQLLANLEFRYPGFLVLCIVGDLGRSDVEARCLKQAHLVLSCPADQLQARKPGLVWEAKPEMLAHEGPAPNLLPHPVPQEPSSRI